MKRKEIDWFIRLENIKTNGNITILSDGRVYIKGLDKLFCCLTKQELEKIKNLFLPYYPIFRRERYINAHDTYFVLRINLKSNKYNDCIKIRDRKMDKLCLNLIDILKKH